MTGGQRLLALGLPLLWVAVLVSATGAVYCKYHSRELFVQLQGLNGRRDQIDAEWGRLQLEQSAWSTYAFVERVATQRLHMVTPDPRDIQIVRP